MERLVDIYVGPLLVTFGGILSVVGVVLAIHSLYRCIPFEGETLNSRYSDVIGYHERKVQRRRGTVGLLLHSVGMALIAAGVWLLR